MITADTDTPRITQSPRETPGPSERYRVPRAFDHGQKHFVSNLLKRLIQEIHRRSLWQVLGIYLVGAWVAFQGIEALADGLAMPEWVPGFAVVLMIAGLPIVLATAFVQEGVGAQEVHAAAPAAFDLPQYARPQLRRVPPYHLVLLS